MINERDYELYLNYDICKREYMDESREESMFGASHWDE